MQGHYKIVTSFCMHMHIHQYLNWTRGCTICQLLHSDPKICVESDTKVDLL